MLATADDESDGQCWLIMSCCLNNLSEGRIKGADPKSNQLLGPISNKTIRSENNGIVTSD